MKWLRALFQGDDGKIEAIKAYREAHPGISLKEAKAAVEAMEQGRQPSRPTVAAGDTSIDQVQELARLGQKIEAIKAYRELHPGAGLREAKEAVEALEQGRQPPRQAAVPPTSSESIDELVRAGKKIQAIKLYRELHPGTGLKDAKDAVDALERQWRTR